MKCKKEKLICIASIEKMKIQFGGEGKVIDNWKSQLSTVSLKWVWSQITLLLATAEGDEEGEAWKRLNLLHDCAGNSGWIYIIM